MLTIDEIRNISFRKSNLRGYSHEDVDAFIDDVILTVEQLKREKADLVRKMDILAKRVEQYRADEETVRNALLSSQKVADASIRDANEKATKIIQDANDEARGILIKADHISSKQKENYTNLLADAVNLRDELLYVYKKHIGIIEELPTEVKLEEKKKELDEKYPTSAVEEAAVSEVNTAEQEKIEESIALQESDFDDGEDNFDQAPAAATKRSSKFSDLKFGENYDVENDD